MLFKSKSNYFEGKRVMITGASSGIGEYLAYELAKQGANLVLASRNLEGLEKVRTNIKESVEVKLQFLDLANLNLLPQVVNNVLEHIGEIDILINNAGISQRSLVKDTDIKVVKKIMEINYLGTVHLTQSFLPHLMKRPQPQIITITSLTGKFSTPYRSAYAASKHALHGWFDALRAEYANDKLKVTLICPGFVRTQLSYNALKGDGSKNNKMDPRTQNGMLPSEFAQKAVKAIRKQKSEVYIGQSEVWAIYLKRFFPKWFENKIANVEVK